MTCGASRRLRAGIPVRFAHSNVVGTRFPLTSSENAAFFVALTLRLCVPHFSTGGLSPYVAVHNPIEDLGRCHSACQDFRFHKSFPGIAKELPAARRAFFHRGIIPLLTLFFSAFGSQKTAVTPKKMRLWGYVVGRRFDVPHFSTGGVAPYVAEVFSAAALKTSCYPP